MAMFSLANLPSCFPVRVLRDIFVVIESLSTRSEVSKSSEVELHESKFEYCPSPLLVLVPLYLIAESNKEQLTTSTYSHIRLKHSSESCDDNCTVCLAVMKGCDEVKKLPICRHVFHKNCIDAWIDECKSTCPICRSELLPGRGEKFKCGGDPWRKERMIYLFGEDFLM